MLGDRRGLKQKTRSWGAVLMGERGEYFVQRAGVEPTATGFSDRHSTTELPMQFSSGGGNRTQ